MIENAYYHHRAVVETKNVKIPDPIWPHYTWKIAAIPEKPIILAASEFIYGRKCLVRAMKIDISRSAKPVGKVRHPGL